ncbi:hypothetical protein EJ08DRAFT_602053 [Tothia fuscella]|uniref:Tyrosine--tRNA ligase n=1 Tax=Tothia fuscella TaxID=1048955 RepID=A0A9P4P5Y6_9PEZI|nr:hypothetical protein EJ08DRAFT_602053 [Tothia fuscella]
MASNTLRIYSGLYSPFVCRRCRVQITRSKAAKQWLRKLSGSQNLPDGEEHRAKDEAKKIPNVLQVLEERGFINQIAGNRDELERTLARKRVGAYLGIDPTASSMHVGHLVPFMALFWLQIYGYPVKYLVGGATGSVGDPTGRTSSRPHLPSDTRNTNVKAIKEQLRRMIGNLGSVTTKHFESQQYLPVQDHGILNNDAWLRKTSIMDILGTIGTGLRLGAMLGRDTVKNKMEKVEGMSFSEFCYPVLQAYDWWHMYASMGVQLQIGGADQYGNILSGIDGIKNALKVTGQSTEEEDEQEGLLSDPMGFTVPLLLAPSGEKFGKSAGNAVWLDVKQTPSFDLYGFFVSQPDSEVERLLKLFTFVELPEIERVMAEHTRSPEKRLAQHLLASEFVSLVHGPDIAEKTAQNHKSMFSAGLISPDDLHRQLSDETWEGPCLACSDFFGLSLSTVMVSAGIAKSKSEARRLISAKGVYILGEAQDANGAPVRGMVPLDSEVETLSSRDLISLKDCDFDVFCIRKGKAKVVNVKVMKDKS